MWDTSLSVDEDVGPFTDLDESSDDDEEDEADERAFLVPLLDKAVCDESCKVNNCKQYVNGE